MTATRLLVGLAVLFGAGHAQAFKYDDCTPVNGQGGAFDYHRQPILIWECYENAMKGTPEYSSYATAYDQIKDELKAPLVFKIDHKSFEDHYAAEAKKPKARDRDPRDPRYYCVAPLDQFSGRSASYEGVMFDIRDNAKVKAEFLGKVKSLTCVYDDKLAYSVALKNGDLVYYMSNKETSPPGDWWPRALRKIFPGYAKYWDENH